MTTAYPMVPAWDSEAFSAAPGHVRSQTFLDDLGVVRSRNVKWLFNDLGAAAEIGRPYMVRFNANSGQNPSIAAALVAPTDTPELVCVALKATADQTWDYFCVEGYTEALVEGGTDVTKGDYLSVDDDIVTGGAFKEDTTTRTKNSFAIYQDATDQTAASASLRLIYMFGQEAEVLT